MRPYGHSQLLFPDFSQYRSLNHNTLPGENRPEHSVVPQRRRTAQTLSPDSFRSHRARDSGQAPASSSRQHAPFPQLSSTTRRQLSHLFSCHRARHLHSPPADTSHLHDRLQQPSSTTPPPWQNRREYWFPCLPPDSAAPSASSHPGSAAVVLLQPSALPQVLAPGLFPLLLSLHPCRSTVSRNLSLPSSSLAFSSCLIFQKKSAPEPGARGRLNVFYG